MIIVSPYTHANLGIPTRPTQKSACYIFCIILVVVDVETLTLLSLLGEDSVSFRPFSGIVAVSLHVALKHAEEQNIEPATTHHQHIQQVINNENI